MTVEIDRAALASIRRGIAGVESSLSPDAEKLMSDHEKIMLNRMLDVARFQIECANVVAELQAARALLSQSEANQALASGLDVKNRDLWGVRDWVEHAHGLAVEFDSDAEIIGDGSSTFLALPSHGVLVLLAMDGVTGAMHVSQLCDLIEQTLELASLVEGRVRSIGVNGATIKERKSGRIHELAGPALGDEWRERNEEKIERLETGVEE